MNSNPGPSEFRFEKRRVDAVVTLAGGESLKGCFFLSAGSTLREGDERIVDLLNTDSGFLPFAIFEAGGGTRTVLYNRAHVVTVQVFDDEARRDPGYAVATRRVVSLVLSDGRRLDGVVRVYLPEGRDRVSDWTRQPEAFRYVETDAATFIVNASHIVALTEVSGS